MRSIQSKWDSGREPTSVEGVVLTAQSRAEARGSRMAKYYATEALAHSLEGRDGEAARDAARSVVQRFTYAYDAERRRNAGR